jgi:hypothetical protein
MGDPGDRLPSVETHLRLLSNLYEVDNSTRVEEVEFKLSLTIPACKSRRYMTYAHYLDMSQRSGHSPRPRRGQRPNVPNLSEAHGALVEPANAGRLR